MGTSVLFLYFQDSGNFSYRCYAASPTLQMSMGKSKCSMVVFSRIQYFLSFIFSNILMSLNGPYETRYAVTNVNFIG
jgi:hypothetical protein